jgi:hypothetical protein
MLIHFGAYLQIFSVREVKAVIGATSCSLMALKEFLDFAFGFTVVIFFLLCIKSFFLSIEEQLY